MAELQIAEFDLDKATPDPSKLRAGRALPDLYAREAQVHAWCAPPDFSFAFTIVGRVMANRQTPADNGLTLRLGSQEERPWPFLYRPDGAPAIELVPAKRCAIAESSFH